MKKEDWQLPIFFMGLTMGAASTLLIKTTYDVGAIDPVTSENIPYQKPIFLTFLMFVAMSFALPLYMFLTRNEAKASQKETGTKQETTPLVNGHVDYSNYSENDPFGDAPLKPIPQDELQEPAPFNVWSWELAKLLMAPSLFDLLGTALSTIGLLYVSVSLYQLSRCCVIIVTAMFKRLLLKHRLTKSMYAGVAINTLAMLTVGAAAILLDTGSSAEGLVQGDDANVRHTTSDTITGLLFILSSCVVQGAQYVYEEKVMALDNIPPLVLVGWEGINGCILSLLFAFPFAHFMPGSDNGHYEDIYGAFTLPFSSPKLMVILIAFFFVIFLYNVFCIYITFLLSSIYHCIMDNARPAAVSAAGLILYYSFGVVGEPWNTNCWFELIAILLMFLGTSVYGGQVKLPCLPVEIREDDEEFEMVFVRDTPVFAARHHAGLGDKEQVNMSSLLTQSPALHAHKASPALHSSSRHAQTQTQYGSTML